MRLLRAIFFGFVGFLAILVALLLLALPASAAEYFWPGSFYPVLYGTGGVILFITFVKWAYEDIG